MGGSLTGLAEWGTDHLQGDMLDPMPVLKDLREAPEERVAGVAGRHHQMHGQGDLRGAHCADVQIVNLTNAGECFQMLPDCPGIDFEGYTIKEHV